MFRLTIDRLLHIYQELRAHVSPKKALLYFFSLAIPFSLENAVDILNLKPAPEDTLLVPVFQYQWIVRSGPRNLKVRFVRLVLIDKEHEPDDVTSEDSPFAQRAFM